MHTFFVNTSEKTLENYYELFDIQHETKQLVFLDCPLAKWTEEEVGYKACVKKMGEQIDSYEEIDNDFNLILYVDLLAFETYASIPMNEHLKRYACLKALRTIVKHYIVSPLLQTMGDVGRKPKEVLIIFEENKLPCDGDEKTESGKDRIRSYIKEFLGLSDIERLKELLRAPGDAGEGITVDDFFEKAEVLFPSPLGRSVLRTYFDEVSILVEKSKASSVTEKDIDDLCDRVVGKCSDTDDLLAYSVSFETDRRAGSTNKRERAHRDLRLCFYIFSCVADKTVLEVDESVDEETPHVKPFYDINWEQVAAEFFAKRKHFAAKYTWLKSAGERFEALDLAPVTYELDYDRFGLDRYGKRDRALGVKEGDGSPDNLLTDDVYEPFQSDDAGEDIKVGRKATDEEYHKAAKKLGRLHEQYADRLREHVFERLSNYAGRSLDNDAEILQRRRVSSEEAAESGLPEEGASGKEYRYAACPPAKESRNKKTVGGIAEEAYRTAILEYMEFCAGRTVAVTDITEQCNWFVKKVDQIRESLKNLKKAAIGLAIALTALYVPYVVLQWKEIVKNALTVSVALSSLLVPMALLFAVFAFAVVKQHRKCYDAWLQLKQASDSAKAANDLVAMKYDQLLNTFIPAVRWIYEYKLDVSFCQECCRLASAKVMHHLQKLERRNVTLGNLIEDLEIGGLLPDSKCEYEDDLDLNMSFCASETNKHYYSIIDKQLLRAIRK